MQPHFERGISPSAALACWRQSRFDVTFTDGLSTGASSQFATAVSGRRVIAVTTPTVDRLYGAALRLLFAGLGALRGRDPPQRLIARAFVAAAFVALIVHTLLYAAFFEDPLAWTLIGVGIVLAGREPGGADRPLLESAAAAHGLGTEARPRGAD